MVTRGTPRSGKRSHLVGSQFQEPEVVLLDTERFFGSAMAVLDATTKAIAAALMQSSFIIAECWIVGRPLTKWRRY
jgi:hypothetical protein